RRPSRAGDGDFVAVDTVIAGGSASGWGVGTAGNSFCGPRRRFVSATVVRVIRGGRRIWWTRVFFLSDFESVYGEVGMGTGDSDRGSKADRRVGVAGVVCRAANSGHQRWSRGALLPQLFPAEYGSGLLV